MINGIKDGMRLRGTRMWKTSVRMFNAHFKHGDSCLDRKHMEGFIRGDQSSVHGSHLIRHFASSKSEMIQWRGSSGIDECCVEYTGVDEVVS